MLELRQLSDENFRSISLVMAQERGEKALKTILWQHKKALKIIQQECKEVFSREQLAECEIHVMGDIEDVRWLKADEKLHYRQLEQAPKKERAVVKALRAVEAAAAKTAAIETGLMEEQFLDNVKRERRLLEQFFDKNTRGGARQNRAKQAAALKAWMQLAEYGIRPSVTPAGPWHRLAATLYGYAAVDSFDINYLRQLKKRMVAQKEKDGRRPV